MGRAEITLPPSSTVICTVTVPDAFAALAIAGYTGWGLLIALPLSTPPEIGALGVDLRGGAGGTPWVKVGGLSISLAGASPGLDAGVDSAISPEEGELLFVFVLLRLPIRLQNDNAKARRAIASVVFICVRLRLTQR